jgi:hypothetical protein
MSRAITVFKVNIREVLNSPAPVFSFFLTRNTGLL